MLCMWVQTQEMHYTSIKRKDGDAVNRREHTNELLIPDVQGHVPERGGHCAHHTVTVDPQQLYEDGQAFLFPDSSSDIYRPLQMRGGQGVRSWGGWKPSKQTAPVGVSDCPPQVTKRVNYQDLLVEQVEPIRHVFKGFNFIFASNLG